VGTRRSFYLDPITRVGLARPDADAGEDSPRLVDGHLHSDADEICPRCLAWIDSRDFVRRTAYGVLQHELCPPQPGPAQP
jgi:hypothetical protein